MSLVDDVVFKQRYSGATVKPLIYDRGVASVWTVEETPGVLYFRVKKPNDPTGWGVAHILIEDFEDIDHLIGLCNQMKFNAPGTWADVFRPGTVLERAG